MKKIIVLAMCVALFGFASSAMAQVKIGVVDLPRSLTTSDEGKKALAELQAAEAEMGGKIQPLREEYNRLEKEYIAQEKVLTESAKKTRVEALQKKGAEVEGLIRTYSAELQKKEQDLSGKIIKELEAVIQEIAKEGKYTLILQSQSVVYNSGDTVDITDKVIERYNKKVK